MTYTNAMQDAHLKSILAQINFASERDRQIATHAFALGANAVLARIYADTNWLNLLREMEVELAEIDEQPNTKQPTTWPGGGTGNEEVAGDDWKRGIVNGRVYEKTEEGIVERP